MRQQERVLSRKPRVEPDLTTDLRRLVHELASDHERRTVPEAPAAPLPRAIESAISWLRGEALPQALDAWAALSAVGVGVDIVENFDVLTLPGSVPSLSFQCVGPVRDNRFGRLERPRSNRFFFECDGVALRVGELDHYVNAQSFQRAGPPVPLASPEASALVGATLAAAIRNYYALLATF